MTTEVLSERNIIPNGLAVGFVPKVRTVRVECDWPDLQPAAGGEQLWAEIEDITFDEQAAIPYGQQFRYADLWAAIAPYVHAWNATGRNRETKQYEALPPPAEAGPEMFSRCPKMVAQWLAIELKYGPLKKDTDPKGSGTDSTPAPVSGTDSASSPKASSRNGTTPRGSRASRARTATTS